MKETLRTCAGCGVTFSSAHPTKKYCTPAHTRKYRTTSPPRGPECLCRCGQRTSHPGTLFKIGHRPRITDTDRADDILARSTRTASGCLEFQGSRTRDGYGILRSKYTRFAHRAIWIHNNGTIAPDLEVCHRCDNPPCVEITHLFLGTHTENMRDASRKGRSGGWAKKPPRGELQANSKLTLDQVREIRRAYEAFLTPRGTKYGILTVLAGRHGVTKEAIRKIIVGENWSHLQ